MLTLTILHELEVDDLLDETGMYLGESTVFTVRFQILDITKRRVQAIFRCRKVLYNHVDVGILVLTDKVGLQLEALNVITLRFALQRP